MPARIRISGPKADEIAAQQLHALRQFSGGKLRLTGVKAMFLEMRDFHDERSS